MDKLSGAVPPPGAVVGAVNDLWSPLTCMCLCFLIRVIGCHMSALCLHACMLACNLHAWSTGTSWHATSAGPSCALRLVPARRCCLASAMAVVLGWSLHLLRLSTFHTLHQSSNASEHCLLPSSLVAPLDSLMVPLALLCPVCRSSGA